MIAVCRRRHGLAIGCVIWCVVWLRVQAMCQPCRCEEQRCARPHDLQRGLLHDRLRVSMSVASLSVPAGLLRTPTQPLHTPCTQTHFQCDVRFDGIGCHIVNVYHLIVLKTIVFNVPSTLAVLTLFLHLKST